MSNRVSFLVFTINGQRYATSSAGVVRVVRSVEVTTLPGAPEIVSGIVNVEGSVVPLVDLRRRFSLPEKEVSWTDQIVLAHTPARLVGVLVDAAEGLIEIEEERFVNGERVLDHLDHIHGVLKLDDGLVLIHDLGSCLSLEEEHALKDALDASEQ